MREAWVQGCGQIPAQLAPLAAPPALGAVRPKSALQAGRTLAPLAAVHIRPRSAGTTLSEPLRAGPEPLRAQPIIGRHLHLRSSATVAVCERSPVQGGHCASNLGAGAEASSPYSPPNHNGLARSISLMAISR